MIYLDNSATTRPFDGVIDVMDRCMREQYFNASAAYKPAVDVDRAMRECRKTIAAQLGIQESGVIFTGGGTESDNLAILGTAAALRQGANFVCSAIEHPAVAETIRRVEQMGLTVRVLPIDARGVVDLAACETVIDEHTALVSCMQVSNETGAIQPVEALNKLARRKNPNVRIHVDGVQGFMRVPMHMERMGVDLYALSGHKIHGPKGIGVLAVRPGVRLIPQITGGGQEKGLRSGTEATPQIAALAAAAKLGKEALDEHIAYLNDLKAYALAQFQALVPGLVVVSAGDAPHICAISLPGYPSQVVVRYLSDQGFCLSAGSACHRGKASHVYAAMNLSKPVRDGMLRVSFGPSNTKEEVDQLAQALLSVTQNLVAAGR